VPSRDNVLLQSIGSFGFDRFRLESKKKCREVSIFVECCLRWGGYVIEVIRGKGVWEIIRESRELVSLGRIVGKL